MRTTRSSSIVLNPYKCSSVLDITMAGRLQVAIYAVSWSKTNIIHLTYELLRVMLLWRPCLILKFIKSADVYCQ